MWPYLAGAVALPFAISLVFTIAWFALAWAFGTPLPPGAKLGLGRRVALFWNEWQTIRRSGPRMIFYRWLTPDPPPAPALFPVLLLHGVLCNAGVWLGLSRHLAAQPPLASIELFADQLAAKIDAILRATGAARVAIVGHSMGGLVARAYLRRYGASRVRLLVTVGTPHHGSVHAWLFPGACLAQLRPGNPWLAALNAAALPGCRIVSLWSRHDSMVAPQASSALPGAEEIVITGVGHNALLADPGVFAAVARELARSRGDEAAAPAA